MSVPQIPPRPTRSPHRHPPMPGMDVPTITPRPKRQTSERSQSPPNREHFPRSPFNEPPSKVPSKKRSGLQMTSMEDQPDTVLPKRPSSVSLPTIGQEGSEYADIVDLEKESAVEEKDGQEPKEMRNVAGDLPLHAPKPSFTKDSAKQRVQAVTRTDSGQAAALGIGKAPTPTGSADREISSKRSVTFRPPSSASTERPSSAQYDDEIGIPEIGQRVPMYPDAGDVQAPSTSPFPQSPVGIGFHNSGYAKPAKHHRRTPSGREVHPPGSYGLHGHGVQSADQFEQSWYAKHPEALEREEGEYGPGVGGHRGEWAMSSNELNKLVRDTARPKKAHVGPPSEQIGYEASEMYSSRTQTPHAGVHGSRSSVSLPTVKSPLRKSSFPVDADAHAEIRKMDSNDSRRSVELALESETEDEDLHIAPPTQRKSKFTGNGYDHPVIDLGPEGGNQEERGGYVEETGYGVPILASDEVAHTPGAEYLQPAVSPAQSRRGSSYYIGQEWESQGLYKLGSRSGSAANSRPSSRPGSIHKLSMHDEDRDMHTPLEDVDEYEPLFPDEEGGKRSLTAAQRLKLREKMKRFPSQDIWEDTPNSLQLQASVDTPEPTMSQEDPMAKSSATAFETPEQEARRKGEVTEQEKAKLLTKEQRLAKSNFKPHLREEVERPGMKQRFPSKDIWEDSPDHAELTTTITGEEAKSPPDAGLEAGAVVQTSGAPRDGVIIGDQPRDLATEGAPAITKVPSIPPRPNKSKISQPGTEANEQPSIPARPPKRLHQVPPADAKPPIAPSKLAQATSPTEVQEPSPVEARKVPSIPDTGKPPIPARPPKKEPSDPSSLTKVTSASSIGSDGSDKGVSTAVPKTKPAIPARPAGGKIAALQGGFLADLNSRLKIGPQGPKPVEKEPETQPEEEKAPLSDARRGRAKGPAKRKPAGAAAAPAPTDKALPARCNISRPRTIWRTDDTGAILVPQIARTLTTQKPPEAASQPAAEIAQPAEKSESPQTLSDRPTTPLVEADRNPLSVAANSPADSPLKTQSPLTQSEVPPAEEPLPASKLSSQPENAESGLSQSMEAEGGVASENAATAAEQ